MTEELKTDRALVFDFGRVVFRWRPEALVSAMMPHRATTPDAVRHWVDQVFQAYDGDWGEFDRGVVEAPELARRIAVAREEVGERVPRQRPASEPHDRASVRTQQPGGAAKERGLPAPPRALESDDLPRP